MEEQVRERQRLYACGCVCARARERAGHVLSLTPAEISSCSLVLNQGGAIGASA
jgi:hypothetical protein